MSESEREYCQYRIGVNDAVKRGIGKRGVVCVWKEGRGLAATFVSSPGSENTPMLTMSE